MRNGRSPAETHSLRSVLLLSELSTNLAKGRVTTSLTDTESSESLVGMSGCVELR